MPASLPAALVAAVAIIGGPGPGMAMGFSAGLLADLASPHHVGVLAATWLLLGMGVGRYADPRRTGGSRLLIAAAGAAAAGALGQLLVAASAGGAVPVLDAPGRGARALVIDLVLLAVLLPPVRAALGRLASPRWGVGRV